MFYIVWVYEKGTSRTIHLFILKLFFFIHQTDDPKYSKVLQAKQHIGEEQTTLELRV